MDKIENALCAMLKHWYEENVKDSLSKLRDLAKEQKIKLSPQIEHELKCLIYYSFDFGIAAGPEIEMRNNLRDYLVIGLDFSQEVMQKMDPHIIEYCEAFKHGKDNFDKTMSVGKVFAKYSNHPNDISLVTWASMIFQSNFRFASYFTSDLLKNVQAQKFT